MIAMSANGIAIVHQHHANQRRRLRRRRAPQQPTANDRGYGAPDHRWSGPAQQRDQPGRFLGCACRQNHCPARWERWRRPAEAAQRCRAGTARCRCEKQPAPDHPRCERAPRPSCATSSPDDSRLILAKASQRVADGSGPLVAGQFLADDLLGRWRAAGPPAGAHLGGAGKISRRTLR